MGKAKKGILDGQRTWIPFRNPILKSDRKYLSYTHVAEISLVARSYISLGGLQELDSNRSAYGPGLTSNPAAVWLRPGGLEYI